jgi:hypothetical protein
MAALVAYGSAVTGDLVPSCSDFDVKLFLRGPLTVADARRCQAAIGGIDREPFAYVQLSVIDVEGEAPAPILGPAYAVLKGGLDLGPYLHTEASLRASGDRGLADLPRWLAEDVADWAVDTGRARSRRVRVMVTRLKPAVRALLVRQGAEPLEVWAAVWPELLHELAGHDAALAEKAGAALARFPCAPEDEPELGVMLLDALMSIAAEG